MAAIAGILAFVLVPLALVALWAVHCYNRIITLGKRRDEAWSGVMVQLKRRHDLIPNLVGTVKGYAAHEKGLLEEVTRARSMGEGRRPGEVEASEKAFSRSLVNLLAVAENYPELKADANFRELQNTLVRTEDDIQMARRYYNGVVRDYNTTISTFPGLLVARQYGFAESPYFNLESPGEAETPTVAF